MLLSYLLIVNKTLLRELRNTLYFVWGSCKLQTICTTQAEPPFSVRERERERERELLNSSSLHKVNRWMGSGGTPHAIGNDKLTGQPFHPRFHIINNNNTLLLSSLLLKRN
jgi:hypothetical protein